MADITCLGYYVLGASDLQAWKSFAEDILGLQVGRYEENELLTLRMDEYEQRIMIEQTPEDDFLAAGWEFDNELVLEEFVHNVTAAGVSIEDGGVELAERRRVQKVYYCHDPDGIRQEFYYGPIIADTTMPFKSKLLYEGFVTGRIGIGHFVPVSQQYPNAVKFYRDILGLRVSDYMKRGGKVQIDATFFHTKSGRHHSVAVGDGKHTKKIRHIMLQVENIVDVGLAMERSMKAGCLVKSIGQHTNDQMISIYINSPSGFQIEYGCNGIIVDDETWNVKTYFESSLWGHKHI